MQMLEAVEAHDRIKRARNQPQSAQKVTRNDFYAVALLPFENMSGLCMPGIAEIVDEDAAIAQQRQGVAMRCEAAAHVGNSCAVRDGFYDNVQMKGEPGSLVPHQGGKIVHDLVDWLDLQARISSNGPVESVA